MIWIDAERMSGAPCFKGTRVPIQNLLNYIEGDSTLDDFVEDFPSVAKQQVEQFLELTNTPMRGYLPSFEMGNASVNIADQDQLLAVMEADELDW